MKKIYLIIISILLMMPIGINAEIMKNYNDGFNYALNYINRFSTRQRYLDLSKPSDMLSKEEFNASKLGNKSYLVSGKEYWTNSGSVSGSHYYIGSDLSSKLDSSKSGVRVTQFVRNDVLVKGNGTYNTPWEFVDSYKVNVVKNLNINEIDASANPTVVISGGSSEVTIKEADAYMYTGNDDCNLKPSNRISKVGYVSKYKLENINKDINCVARFEKRVVKVYYDCDGGSGAPAVQTIVFNGNYKIAEGVCDKSGYSQQTWKAGTFEYTPGKTGTWTTKEGTNGVENNELHLKAIYKDTTAPTIKVIANDKNNTSTILQAEQTFAPSANTTTYTGTYNVQISKWINNEVTFTFKASDNSGGKVKWSWRYNSDGSATDTGNTYNSFGTPTNLAANLTLTRNITSSGYRKAQLKFEDESGNSNTITVAVKIDRKAPTCSLQVNGSNNVVFKTKEDSFSGIKSTGLIKTTSTATYNSTTQLAASAGTFYGYVKDNLGNEGKCQTTVKATTVSSWTKTTQTCNRYISGTYSYSCNGSCSALSLDDAAGRGCTCSNSKEQFYWTSQGRPAGFEDKDCPKANLQSTLCIEKIGGSPSGTTDSCRSCKKCTSYSGTYNTTCNDGICTASTCSTAGCTCTYGFGTATDSSNQTSCSTSTFTCGSSYVGQSKTTACTASGWSCDSDYTKASNSWCYK